MPAWAYSRAYEVEKEEGRWNRGCLGIAGVLRVECDGAAEVSEGALLLIEAGVIGLGDGHEERVVVVLEVVHLEEDPGQLQARFAVMSIVSRKEVRRRTDILKKKKRRREEALDDLLEELLRLLGVAHAHVHGLVEELINVGLLHVVDGLVDEEEREELGGGSQTEEARPLQRQPAPAQVNGLSPPTTLQ